MIRGDKWNMSGLITHNISKTKQNKKFENLVAVKKATVPGGDERLVMDE